MWNQLSYITLGRGPPGVPLGYILVPRLFFFLSDCTYILPCRPASSPPLFYGRIYLSFRACLSCLLCRIEVLALLACRAFLRHIPMLARGTGEHQPPFGACILVEISRISFFSYGGVFWSIDAALVKLWPLKLILRFGHSS